MPQCRFQCLFGHLRCRDFGNGSKQCDVVFSERYTV